jgi:hypothetical protein
MTDTTPQTTACPECGDAEFDQGEWREGNYEHICKGCGQSWFPDIVYLPPLPPEAVAQMQAIAAEHDEAPLREAWKRGAEAMRTVLLQYCEDVNIREGGVPLALSNLKLPPYQPKETTP